MKLQHMTHTRVHVHTLLLAGSVRAVSSKKNVKTMDKENEIWRPWVSPSSSFTKSPLPTPQRRVQPIQPRRLSQLEAPHPSRRFAKPLTREQARQQTQPYIPKRTQQCNTWALGVFKSWADSRNQETPVDAPKCATDLLQAQHPLAKVDLWLALFVLEVRRVDGEYYPPSTLQNILIPSLQREPWSGGA
jgi:hypothetical protein